MFQLPESQVPLGVVILKHMHCKYSTRHIGLLLHSQRDNATPMHRGYITICMELKEVMNLDQVCIVFLAQFGYYNFYFAFKIIFACMCMYMLVCWKGSQGVQLQVHLSIHFYNHCVKHLICMLFIDGSYRGGVQILRRYAILVSAFHISENNTLYMKNYNLPEWLLYLSKLVLCTAIYTFVCLYRFYTHVLQP